MWLIRFCSLSIFDFIFGFAVLLLHKLNNCNYLWIIDIHPQQMLQKNTIFSAFYISLLRKSNYHRFVFTVSTSSVWCFFRHSNMCHVVVCGFALFHSIVSVCYCVSAIMFDFSHIIWYFGIVLKPRVNPTIYNQCSL